MAVVSYEGTMLGAIIFTVLGVIFESRLPKLKGGIYDTHITEGYIGVLVNTEETEHDRVQGVLNQVGAVDVLQRQVSIRVEVELIDLVEDVILWDDLGLSTQGQYLEGEPEEIGRIEAIELIAQRIVDGAQSNW